MPCVSLKHRKIHRATIVRNSRSDLYSSQPVTPDDLCQVSAEVADLVDTALDAELKAEPSSPESSSVPLKAYVPSRRKILQRIVRPLKLRILRRATMKAAQKVASQSSSTSVPAPTPASGITSALQVLHDGDHIRLRPGRTSVSAVAERYLSSSDSALKSAAKNPGPATISTHDAISPKHSRRRNKPQTPLAIIARHSRFGRRHLTRSDLINAESCLGRTLFGPIPARHRREFFHDRDNIWIWHEGWIDSKHHARQMTIRYEVRPSGIYKKISAGKYFKLEGDELENFRRATHAYLNIIKHNLYLQPDTDRPTA